MLIIAYYLFLQITTLLGMGFIFFKLTKVKETNIGLIGLSGILFSSLIAAAWSLFAPVSILSYLILILGILSAIFSFRQKLSVFSILLFFAMLFPIYISSPQYDTGLYHLSQIVIERSQPLSFGLANLHSRLGFNSLWLTYAASMGFGSQWKIGSFLVNASLMYFFLHFVWEKLKINAKNEKHKAVPVITLALFSLYCFWQLYRPADLGGPNTDFSSQIFGISGLSLFWMYFYNKKSITLQFAIFLMGFAVLFKFSNIGIIVIPLIYALWKYGFNFFKSRLIIAIFSALIIWIIRNLVLSGCLIPLIHSSCTPVSWSANDQMVQVTSWVKSWARQPGLSPEIVLSSTLWFKNYWIHVMYSIFWVRLTLILSILVGLKYIFRRNNFSKYLGLWFVISSIAIYFFVWFIGAPDYRFASFYIVFTCCILLSTLITFSQFYNYFVWQSVFLFITTILIIGSLYRMFIFRHQLFESWPRYTTPPSVVLSRPESGLVFYGTTLSDQCFDIPWCTPEYSDQIRVTEKWGRLVFTRKQD